LIVKFSKRFSVWGVAAIIFFLINAAPVDSYAQEKGKSKYEKMQEKRIKRINKKRLKSEKARRSRIQNNPLDFKPSPDRRGDQPYQENSYNRSNRKRISSSSTPAVYAQPDPYATRSRSRRRNVYSNDDLKRAPRPAAKAWKGDIAGNTGKRSRSSARPTIHAQPDPYKNRSRADRRRNVYSNDKLKSGSPPPSKAWEGDISGRKLRTKRQPRGRINAVPEVNPYSHRKLRSEGERISRNQDSYGTSPRSTERPPKRGRINVQSASGRYTVNRRANPYRFRGRHKWENTYTGGFYGRREGIKPRNTQRISGLGSANPYKNRGRLGDKPYRGDISGGYKTTPRDSERAWKGDIAGRKLRTKREPQGIVNVHPGVNPYGNRLKRSERDRISRNQEFIGATPRSTERPARKGRVSINTATKPYIVRRKAKPYKIRDVKKWEEVYSGGFYGRREGIRPKNTQGVSSLASPDPYAKRGRMGDKPYRGAISGGGFRSATKKGETAWKGDVAGRRINYSRPHDNEKSGDRFGRSSNVATISGGLHNNGGRAINTTGGGSITRTMKRDNNGKAILSFVPGKAALKATSSRGKHNMFEVAPGFSDANINYQGDIKSRRPEKGGGSISGDRWNNKGRALPQRYDKGSRVAGGFSGNIKAERPLFGGGSISRNDWNNKGRALPQRYDKDSRVTAGFSGNIKAEKPLFGGGSLSRNDWNNKGRALPQRYDKDSRVAGGFSGNIKARKPLTGGGSISGDNWNNKGQALPKRYNNKESRIAGSFSGDIKASKPTVGGGSLSRNDWNNRGQALAQSYDDRNSRIPGSFSGSLKASRPDKGGGSVTREDAWNNSGSPLPKSSLTSAASRSSRHTGDRKQKKSRLARNQKADDDALMVRKPTRTYFAAGNFRGSKKEKRKVDGQTHTSTNFFTSKESSNAVEEKKKFISFKLLWNRWFGKTTPENEDKERKPRYDRKEKGLWHE
jgi:hypothetical protein